MKEIINIIALIGFYIIGGLFFLARVCLILLNILQYGKDFNKGREVWSKYHDDIVYLDPIDLDMIKWYFLIGLISGIYLYYTGQLQWMIKWLDKRNGKEDQNRG